MACGLALSIQRRCQVAQDLNELMNSHTLNFLIRLDNDYAQ